MVYGFALQGICAGWNECGWSSGVGRNNPYNMLKKIWEHLSWSRGALCFCFICQKLHIRTSTFCMFSFNLKHFLSLNYKIHMKRQYIYGIYPYIYVKVCIYIYQICIWGGGFFMVGVMCAWLIFYRTKCRSCFWSFRFLPAASIECEAVLGHVKRLPNTHTHTHTQKKKVTKTMADSLFWAPDRTRPGTQKQTRDPAIPAPGSAAAAAAATSAVGAMGQELEQAIYSYAATWLTKSTCGCRSQYPNKGSNNSVVGYTVRIRNSICLSN